MALLAWAALWMLPAQVLAFGPAPAEPAAEPTAAEPTPAEPTPAPADPPTTPPSETAAPEASAAVRAEQAKILQQRADLIDALIDGTADPALDLEGLFELDLRDEQSSAQGLLALLRAIDTPADEAASEVPPDPETKPGPKPIADPLDAATAQLAQAYARFFGLSAARQQELLLAHRERGEQAAAAAKLANERSAHADELIAHAAKIEAFLAGTLDVEFDPQQLFSVDLLAPTEFALSAVRRKGLTATPQVPAVPSDKQPSPDPMRAAELRLDRARLAFLALPLDQRLGLFAAHAARQAEAAAPPPPPDPIEQGDTDGEDQDVPIEFVDPEIEETKEQINEAKQEAAQAAIDKEEALEVARKARTEALRVVARERARLLGIKEQQANYAGSLPQWKQDTKAAHEQALQWHRKVQELTSRIPPTPGVEPQADAMYDEVRQVLKTNRHMLAAALNRLSQPGVSVPTPGGEIDDAGLPADVERKDLTRLRDELVATAWELRVQEVQVGWEVAALLRDDVVLLNHDRLALLELTSARLRARVTGLGADGLDQVSREFEQITLELRYHAMSLPRDLTALVRTMGKNPIDVVVEAIELLVLLACFRWWRRNADTVLQRWQYGRPNTAGVTRLGRAGKRALWYLRRIRKPLEWLFLLAVVPFVLGDTQNVPELKLLWLVLIWGLSGWGVVLMVDAVAARQNYYLAAAPTNAQLRFRSLRLLGISVTSVGLILSLTGEIVGRGAVYHWVWQTCWVLIAPIGMWLVLRWRATIVERIAALPRPNAMLRWINNKHTGIAGFAAAAVGGVYLLYFGLSRWTVRQLSELDTTRRVLAYLFRREVAKRAETRAVGPRGEKISGELYDALGPEFEAVAAMSGPAAESVAKVVALTEATTTTLTAVVGERGAGKSTFLARVVGETTGKTCVVGCPPQGFEALLATLAHNFAAADPSPQTVANAIVAAGPSVVCIDDAHRMIAPAVGGLDQLDAFTRFTLAVGGDVSWVVAIQKAAWDFVSRARGDRVFFDQVITLPRWSESEISELIRARTKSAGVEPAFDELVVSSQMQDEDGPTEGERSELGYYRILWDHSSGNPAVALHAWRESLFVHATDPEQPHVHLFEEPSAAEVERLPATLLFVLRAVVQLELASIADVALCTQLPESDVADALRFSLTRGYVEHVGERVRLAWPWYRTITTVLTRQHLLVS